MFRKFLKIGFISLLLQGCGSLQPIKEVKFELINKNEKYDLINQEVDLEFLREQMDTNFDRAIYGLYGESKCFRSTDGTITSKRCEIQTGETILGFEKWGCDYDSDETNSPTSILRREVLLEDETANFETLLLIENGDFSLRISLDKPNCDLTLIFSNPGFGNSGLGSIEFHQYENSESFVINLESDLYVEGIDSLELTGKETELRVVDGVCITSEASFEVIKEVLILFQDNIDLMITHTREMYLDIKVDIDNYIRLDEIARLIKETSFAVR